MFFKQLKIAIKDELEIIDRKSARRLSLDWTDIGIAHPGPNPIQFSVIGTPPQVRIEFILLIDRLVGGWVDRSAPMNPIEPAMGHASFVWPPEFAWSKKYVRRHEYEGFFMIPINKFRG